MIEPLRLSVEVACPADVAFGVWTADTTRWWPPGHTATGAPGSTVTFEPYVGGRVYERTAAGEEIDWGRILAWEPPRRLVYSWHLRADRGDATEVEIAFVEVGGGRSRLDIVHRGWERLGERGPGWRERNQRGWAGVLPPFAAACDARQPG